MTRARSGRGRAPQGFGSIRRTDRGWEAWISLGTGPDGKRIRRHITAATPAELQAMTSELQDRARNGTLFSTQITLGDWLHHWLKINGRSVRPATYEKHRWAIEQHLIPALGRMRLIDLRTEHVELALDRMKSVRDPSEPASNATRVEILKVLRSALNEAVRRDHIERNVARHARLPAHEEVEVEPLTPEEIAAIVSACLDRWNGARWLLALMLGLRQSEALGLWWSDIDLDAGTLQVRRQLSRQNWRHGCADQPHCAPKPSHCPRRWRTPRWADTTKTRAGRRTLALDDGLIELLRAHRSRQVAHRLCVGGDWTQLADEPWLFTGRTGHPVDHGNDRRDWDAVLAAAGVRAARIRDLRHTNATLLLMEGIDIRVVQELLGWTRPQIAARYQHPVSEMKKEAAARVAGQVLGRRNPTGG